jgi:para-nitrobenzyl esterase
VKGLIFKSGCHAFYGIPFAKAKRLQKPQPVEPWGAEELTTYQFGPACPQPAFGFSRLTNEGLLAFVLEELFPPVIQEYVPSRYKLKSYNYGNLSEEHCLNLNVYTPGTDEKKRAVLVFIHGGVFQSGSNAEGGLYDGCRLAMQEDVVVVTINYRLGPFGFLHFPEHGITNLGIRDQICGLEWVRDNISSFGGDPANVTLFGESAGGMSIAILLQSPLARGLFHGAILFSGGLMLGQTKERNQRVIQILEKVLQKKFKLKGKLTPESLCEMPVETLVDSVQG